MNVVGQYMLLMGLTPSSTLDDLERSSAFLIRAFHPDRWPPEDQAEAAKRLREVLFARDQLRKVFSMRMPTPPVKRAPSGS